MATLHQIQAALQEQISSTVGAIVVGNKETVVLGGRATPLDVVTLELTSSGISGSPVSLSYTVKATDQLQNITTALARMVNTNAALQAAGIRAVPSTQGPTLWAYYPAGLSVAWSFSLSVGATETVLLTNLAVTPSTGIAWPALPTLQEVARGGAAPITVYDRRIGKNVTRWSPQPISTVVTEATLTTEISSEVIPHGGSVVITLGGTITVGDAVSAVLTSFMSAPPSPNTQAAQVVSGTASDTPSTMASKLAAAINGDPVLSTWVTAVASGPAVTLTSIVAAGQLGLQSYTGNGGVQTTEIARRLRQFQIVAWTQTEVLRQAVTDPIDVMLAQDDTNFGIVLLDGTPIRVMYEGDYDLEDDTLEDVYRRDFIVSVDYPVTSTDQLYAVLAPVAAFAVE
jgi:hypothetical protein